jgi:hypothetical protein
MAGGQPSFASAGQHSLWLQREARFEAEPDINVPIPQQR